MVLLGHYATRQDQIIDALKYNVNIFVANHSAHFKAM